MSRAYTWPPHWQQQLRQRACRQRRCAASSNPVAEQQTGHSRATHTRELHACLDWLFSSPSVSSPQNDPQQGGSTSGGVRAEAAEQRSMSSTRQTSGVCQTCSREWGGGGTATGGSERVNGQAEVNTDNVCTFAALQRRANTEHNRIGPKGEKQSRCC